MLETVAKTTSTEIIEMQKPQRFSSWSDEEYNNTVAEKYLLYPKKHKNYERSFKNK